MIATAALGRCCTAPLWEPQEAVQPAASGAAAADAAAVRGRLNLGMVMGRQGRVQMTGLGTARCCSSCGCCPAALVLVVLVC